MASGRRFLPVVRGRGNDALLLGLALGAGRWPDNNSDTARRLGLERRSVRRWRDRLVADGLLARVDGWLVPEPAAARLPADPLPWRLVRRRGQKPAPEVLRAAAVLCADLLGNRPTRAGIRSDAERAALAGVSRDTAIAARHLLADADLIEQQVEHRGRCRLVRLVPVRSKSDVPVVAHGNRPAEQHLATAAERASRGRRGGTQVDSVGGTQVDSPNQFPTGTTPSGTSPVVGSEVAPRRDGAPAAQPQSEQTTDPAPTTAVANLAAAAQNGDDLLQHLLARPTTETSKPKPSALPRLLRDAERAERSVENGLVGDILADAGVFVELPGARDRARACRALARRRAGLALRLQQAAHGSDRAALLVLRVAADVFAARSVKNPGAVVARRLFRFIAENDSPDAMTRAAGEFARLSPTDIVDVFAGRRTLPTRRGHRAAERVAPPPPRGHEREHRRVLGIGIGAAQAGDWRRLARLLDSSGARELGIDVVTVSDASGVAERDIEAGLAAVRDEQLARLRGAAG